MTDTQESEPQERKEQLYHVTWEIDIGAASPKEAAEKALAIQHDPDSLATVFDVADEAGDITRIDLDDPDTDEAES